MFLKANRFIYQLSEVLKVSITFFFRKKKREVGFRVERLPLINLRKWKGRNYKEMKSRERRGSENGRKGDERGRRETDKKGADSWIAHTDSDVDSVRLERRHKTSRAV